jgi:hypothetical protein
MLLSDHATLLSNPSYYYHISEDLLSVFKLSILIVIVSVSLMLRELNTCNHILHIFVTLRIIVQ